MDESKEVKKERRRMIGLDLNLNWSGQWSDLHDAEEEENEDKDGDDDEDVNVSRSRRKTKRKKGTKEKVCGLCLCLSLGYDLMRTANNQGTLTHGPGLVLVLELEFRLDENGSARTHGPGQHKHNTWSPDTQQGED